MKLLVFILALALSTQPLQARACDMDMGENQETAQNMDTSGPDGHDCCDSEDADSDDGCGEGMHCGMCYVSVSAMPSIPRVVPFWSHPVFRESSSGELLPSHASPPFRPPIA